MTRLERRETWARHIENYRASGLTAAKWCEEDGVNIYTLKNWIRKFNKENLFHAAHTQWIALGTIPADLSQKDSPLIVNIGCASVEVRPGFDAKTFEKIVLILAEQC